ncbi:RagB/SusD family nutrient uptake outer membrane protein [Leptobacterium sp. I13]|uniref:RagB/SusD family nutrient uptake outer membrane protein n=1 Tax=Leptobacterium meishanense TaxID=3128904 RepID=UPI0030EE13E3
MKKIINKITYILTMTIFVSAVSCVEKLDIGPEDSITNSAILSDPGLVEGVLVGAYSRLQSDNVMNGTPQLAQEWMSDNVNFVGSFPTFREMRDYITLANNTSIFPFWRNSYRVISSANFLINNLPAADVPGLSNTDRDRIIAEAKFIRALVNFQLVNLFAQPYQFSNGSNLGIPLVTEFFEGDPSQFQLAASTVNEVHAAIEQDLTDAIPGLLTSTSRGLASKGAARALLARLYLYREQFAEAADFANQVIQSSEYSLASDYSFYNQLTSEDVFTVINTAIDGQTSGQGFSGLSNPAPIGRGDAPFSQNLLDAFAAEPGDLRFTTLNQVGTDAESGTSTFSSKFPDGINLTDNAPVIRITEMYLIRAEANLRGGTTVGATPLSDINTLRNRAGLAPLGSVNLDAILLERRKELCFEGHRRMDLLRNGMALRRPGMPNEAASAFGADKTILPIPTSERDLNPNIHQNPGY